LRGYCARPPVARTPPSVLAEVTGLDVVSSVVLALLEDAAYPRSVLRAVLVLNALPADGSARKLTDIARDVDLSLSTMHRYAQTWIALGLIEQHPRSRRYRRARVAGRRWEACDRGWWW
jgi:hypothetical protein